LNRAPAAKPPDRRFAIVLVLINALLLAVVYLAATVDVAMLVPDAASDGRTNGAAVGPMRLASGRSDDGGDGTASRLRDDPINPAKPIALEPVLEDREEVLARPLFRPDRRPWQPRLADASSVNPPLTSAPLDTTLPPPDIRLLGIIRAGVTARALIRSGATPTGKWYVRGDQVEGWRLSDVAKDRIVIEARGQRQELALDRSGGGDRRYAATLALKDRPLEPQ